MTFTTIDLTKRIGSEVKTRLETLLDGSIAQELRALLERRGVLLFRGLDMTDEQQIQFAKTLGTTHTFDGNSVQTVTSDKKKNADWAEYTEGTFFFHFDDSHRDLPAFASVLRARVVAPSGGQTEFANTYAIYEDLIEDEQRFLDGLHAVHSGETFQRKAYPNPTESQLSRWGDKVFLRRRIGTHYHCRGVA